MGWSQLHSSAAPHEPVRQGIRENSGMEYWSLIWEVKRFCSRFCSCFSLYEHILIINKLHFHQVESLLTVNFKLSPCLYLFFTLSHCPIEVDEWESSWTGISQPSLPSTWWNVPAPERQNSGNFFQYRF